MSGLMIESMGCPNCGAPFDPRGRICEYCGSVLIVSSTADTFSRTVDGHQIAQALEKWRERLKQDPNSAEAHYAIGLTYLNGKLREQAIEHLKQAVKNAPEVADINYTLGVALFNDGNHTPEERGEAMKAMGLATTLAPDFRDAAAYKHYFTGFQLYDGGNYVGAIHEFILSTQVSPDLALVWFQMGVSYGCVDQRADAETCLRRAVNLSPNNLMYCGGLAAVIENKDEAIQLCKHALPFYDPGIHQPKEAAMANYSLYYNHIIKAEANEWNPTLLEEAHSALKNVVALYDKEVEALGMVDEEELENRMEWMETTASNGYKLTFAQRLGF